MTNEARERDGLQIGQPTRRVMRSTRAVSIAIAVLLRGMAPAAAETVDGRRIVILDGGTVALPCVTPYRGCAEKIRLADIDAPEVSKPACDDELQLGLAAKDVLAEQLRAGPVEVRRTGRKDQYGRTLGSLVASGRDVSQALLEVNLAVRYEPGRAAWERRKAHWCKAN